MSNLDTSPSEPDKDKYLTQPEREQLQRLLSQPEEFPRELGSWITDYVGTNAFLQKSQVQGLPLLNTQVAQALETLDATVEALSVIGTTYQDSFTAEVTVSAGVQSDPVISVPAGTYFCILSAQGQITDGTGYVTIQLYDSSGAAGFGSVGKVEASSVPGPVTGIMSIGSVTVSGSSNDIKMIVTRSGAGNRRISNLTLIALRTA